MSNSNGADQGSGYSLPPTILSTCTLASLVSTALSIWTIHLQLKNYRKIHLQRWVTRILIMVPIYSLASLISLYSSSASFFIDAIRDVYEAFVIYCFFNLLVEYLGGERSLIILLHGRPPTKHVFPINYCLPPIDISDPFSFLAVKRGILQYVQIKPVLAVLTMVLKALGKYSEGTLQADNGYTYISIVYNLSVALSLYCLVLFWSCIHDDLLPFRPLPKFLCVKGLIFATFWQNFMISILVSAGAVKYPGYSKDDLSLAISDALICYEMPLFAILHLYAFSYTDYVDDNLYAGRLPVYYAFRDSLLGYKDVFKDSLTTFRGTGFSYRTFEPAEGAMHHGIARDKRFRAGLRYAQGGKAKYWLPMPGSESGEAYGRRREDGKRAWKDFLKRPIEETTKAIQESRMTAAGYAPISPEQAADVVNPDPRAVHEHRQEREGRWEDSGNIYRAYDLQSESDSDSDVSFDSPASEDERLFRDAKKLEFGDFFSPNVDASKEEARRRMREDEDALLYGRQGTKGKERSKKPPRRRPSAKASNADVKSDDRKTAPTPAPKPDSPQKEAPENDLPEGCVDIVVEDVEAEQKLDAHDRLKGEVTQLGGRRRKVYRRKYDAGNYSSASSNASSSAAPSPRASPNLNGASTLPSLKEDGSAVGDGEEEVQVVVVDREGIAQSERNTDQPVAKLPDVPLSTEAKSPEYVRQSGFVSEEHGGSPHATNPWLQT